MSDVVTFGEAMVRLSPPNFQRLEQTTTLDMSVGGAEYNVAAGVTRFGLSAAWVSRMPDNPLGWFVRNQVRLFGVDTSHIVWTDGDRMGLYWLEFGASPRAPGVLYDRTGSAMSRVRPGEIDWKAAFAGARLFHCSGITPALSDSAAESTLEALKMAKAAGLKVSWDPNYRSKLWTIDKACAVQTPMMEYVDCFITGTSAGGRPEEAVFGITGKTPGDVAQKLTDRFGFEAVAITLRGSPTILRNTLTAIAWYDGREYSTKRYDLEIIDRVGGGDSFTAGFIGGYLQGDMQKALDYGTAFSALKHSILGDLNWATFEEVEQTVKGGGRGISR